MPSDTDKTSNQHQTLIKAWDAAFAEQRVIYLSGPITTGIRFLRWYSRVGRTLSGEAAYEASHRADVIEPNEADLLLAAKQLRLERSKIVIEPTTIEVREWSQKDYVRLWQAFIEKHASQVVMMPGWQYSSGCVNEYLHAAKHDIRVETLEGIELPLFRGAILVESAMAEIAKSGISTKAFGVILSELQQLIASRRSSNISLQKTITRKDESLDRLAESINVAQFISYSPGNTIRQEYCRVSGFSPNHRFATVKVGIENLLRLSPESSVNVRSFSPESPLSREFIYGLKSVDEVVSAVTRLSGEGLNTIVNETVDVHDAGVSGVIMGDTIEFAPDDTPRCVEKPGVASLPRTWGPLLLATVYRFEPDLNVPRSSRLEFSLHPKRRGWRNTHTLGWEYESDVSSDLVSDVRWPNRFSRMIGDKVFGLLVAHHAGLPVPRSNVVHRRLAPFTFGIETGRSETWLRTSPYEQVPGKYTTTSSWTDPFKLMANEDPGGDVLPAIIAQAAVPTEYSGAAIETASGELIIEGKSGEGESFMRGLSPPEQLPQKVASAVRELHSYATRLFGPVRFEWVFDGKQAWIVQFHRGATISSSLMIVPGQVDNWIIFDAHEGLERLRELLRTMNPQHGLEVRGNIGLTSHLADVIRRAKRPARIKKI